MVPAATYIQAAPKVIPIILTVGGATVASRSLNHYNREPVRAKPSSYQSKPIQPRSKYFELVLESVFA
ncbi:hypothetical protein ACHAPU_007513 [Fusarium lateritium]